MENSQNLQVQKQNEVAAFNFFNPEHLEAMQRVCRMFASSELVPDMYKTNLALKNGAAINPENKAIANCMIAIEIAQRIGASPLMVMQNLVIIYGRPSWSSKFLIATVNTCGRFDPLQYEFTNLGKLGKVPYTDYVWNGQRKEAVQKEFDGTRMDNIQCVAFTTEKGSDKRLESSPVSIKMAIQEGWYTKAGSKWQTMERQMLTYRTASFWTNAYAPELSMGMKTVDEVTDIEDIIDIDHEDVSKRVAREKEQNANKEVIKLEPDPVEEPNTSNQEDPESNVENKGVKNVDPKNVNAELFENPSDSAPKPAF